MFNQDQIKSAARGALKWVGGLLIAHHATKAASLIDINAETIIGLITTIYGFLSSHKFHADPPPADTKGPLFPSGGNPSLNLLLLLCVGLPFIPACNHDCRAQSTNAPTLSVPSLTLTNVISGPTLQLAEDFGAFFTDAAPYFGTNQQVGVTLLALNSAGQWGGIALLTVPATSQLSLGFGGSYIGHTWYDATAQVNWGTTWTPPIIGGITGPIFTWIESGPGFNLHSKTLIEQSATGGTWKHDFGTHWTIKLDAGIVNISDRAKIGKIFGGGFNYKF